jgi:predicted flap endonuclease-1-like 5' DNA nuclease
VFVILAVAAVAIALGLGYLIGRARRAESAAAAPPRAAAPAAPPVPLAAPPVPAAMPSPPPAPSPDGAIAERARLVRSGEAESAALRAALARRDATIAQLDDLAAERRRLFAALAQAHAETARYRQLVIDLEDNAPPPLLGGPGAPDDLKLIVGVGPVLERMLYQLGITTYRQIARWTERDIDEYDARLHEFPGRIRRDGWVTQARALHQSKYGATLPLRDTR